MIFDKIFNKGKDTTSSPSVTIDYYSEGVSQYNAGNYTQAMEFFQAVIDSQPTKESAYLKLAETYIKMGKEDLAKKTLFALLAIKPIHKEALAKIQFFLTPKPEQTKVSSKTVQKQASDSYTSVKAQTVQQVNAKVAIPQPTVSHPSVPNDPIVNVLPPSQNNTHYWMIEQQSGNRLYVKVEQDYCVVVPPEKNGWTGFMKPHGILSIPDSVKIDGLDFAVKTIGDKAFSLCDGITEIKIPETIERIGIQSFWGTHIKNIYLPDSIIDIDRGAFGECRLLSQARLPNSIKIIRMSTFTATNLTFIDIPEKVTEIEMDAFKGWLYTTSVEKIRVHGMPFAIEHAFGYNCSFDKISAEVPIAYLSAYQNARFWQTMKLIPF